MSLIDEINSNKYIYLSSIGEPEDNVLRLVIQGAASAEYQEELKIGEYSTQVSPILGSGSEYEITFPNYVAYAVRNESFDKLDESEVFTGGVFREYSKSHFLDFVRSATWADDEHPGKLTNFGIICLNHVIDVVSDTQPLVNGINNDAGPAIKEWVS